MIKYCENEKFNTYSDKLMKSSGKSDTVAGEIVRAVNRICYRFYNDGDIIGCGYGNETCNAAGRYLFEYGNKAIKDVVNELWDGRVKNEFEAMEDSLYELLLSRLVEETVKYLDSKSEELNNKTPDMLDFASDFDSVYDLEDESVY